MTATKDYFRQQLADTVSKALGVPVTDVQILEDQIVVTASVIDTEAPFWLAVKEQAGNE